MMNAIVTTALIDISADPYASASGEMQSAVFDHSVWGGQLKCAL